MTVGELLADFPLVFPRWVSAILCAVLVAFLIINIGLRAVPEGRRFLAAAARHGRIFANPTRGSAPVVKLIFMAAWALAALAGALFYWLTERPPAWPLPQPVVASL